MAYEYDVFLSYNRKFPHGNWVNDIFYPFFEPYLTDALGRRVRIFKDTAEIKNGNDWKAKIRKDLVHSRVMVSIFSPAYFLSEWCMREFAVLHHRQNELGFVSNENPNGLIIPLKLFDGEHYPDFAQSLQMLDCIRFNKVGAGVQHSQAYIDLQSELQAWVYDVANAINKAPAWDAAWLDEDWVEQAYDKLHLSLIPKNTPPPIL